MTKLIPSFVDSANSSDCDFPLNNLPYGVFSQGGEKCCGVAIGDFVLDVAQLERDGVIELGGSYLQQGRWNPVMGAGSRCLENVAHTALANSLRREHGTIQRQ